MTKLLIRDRKVGDRRARTHFRGRRDGRFVSAGADLSEANRFYAG